MISIERFEPLDDYNLRDFHAVMTTTWGELRDGGWIDWDDPDWHWDAYSDEQRGRLQRRIDRRFWYREISALPPDRFRRQFLESLEDAMRVARWMYAAIDSGADILTELDEFHKSRDIRSEFPQTLLNGTSQDYASDGLDREYETIRDRGLIDALEDAATRFRDPDSFVLEKLEVNFSRLISLEIGGY